MIFWLRLGNPAILRQNPNKITVLYGCSFGFKKLGLGQTHPPSPRWDKIPTLDEIFEGLPYIEHTTKRNTITVLGHGLGSLVPIVRKYSANHNGIEGPLTINCYS